jgi:hypothetical protein
MSTPDYENMTDEEFAKLESPQGSEAEQAPVDDTVEETPTLPEGSSGLFADDFDEDDTVEASLNTKTEEPSEEADPVEGGDEAPDAETPAEETAEENAEDVAEDAATVPGSEDSHTKSKQTTEAETKTETPAETKGNGGSSLSPEDAYKRIMAPFKANGKEFTPKDPDEVIRLMQMGAGYNRKMAELKPNLRMMKMLEKKGLLDEGKLNFLIDVNDRNPAAIQKLLHDSKIDPLDLDTSEEPKYQPTNHSVSDEEYTFTETLNAIKREEGGSETVNVINQQWDRASKEEVFKEPSIIGLIHEQRQNGIYDKITAELDRQKMLGAFEGEPFIYAYKAVGDYLHSRGELIPASTETSSAGPAETTSKPREMVETRTATQKAKLANSDRVQAAASPRSNPGQPKAPFDPVNMSDEEIMRMTRPPSS